jgi:hypothetical protein
MPFSKFDLYKNNYFVETGSYYGNGIQSAIDAGFRNVISIEITDKYFRHCVNRFRNNKNVTLVFGDSAEKLSEVISNIKEQITFYLDGHWDLDEDETRGIFDFPIYKELEIIATHPVKTHTIIIDDVRLFKALWNVSEDIIVNKLLEINPQYVIEYADGYTDKDVLIAHI